MIIDTQLEGETTTLTACGSREAVAIVEDASPKVTFLMAIDNTVTTLACQCRRHSRV